MKNNWSDTFRSLLRQYPLCAIAIALIAGILGGNSFTLPLWIPCLICASMFIAMLLTANKKIFTAFAAVFFIALGLGLINLKEQKQYKISDEIGTFQLLINDFPTIKSSSVSVESILSDDAGTHKIMLRLKRDSLSENLTLGDIILTSGTLSLPRQLNPESFDYGKYLVSQGYSASLYSYSWQLVGHTEAQHDIRTWGRRQQHRITEYYKERGFKSRELGVLSALTIGERDLLDNDTRTAFSAAGAMHVLAVSGLHVGIIYLILINIFTLFGRAKPLRKETLLQLVQSACIIIILWGYAIVTGLSPSVVRATLMFSLGEIGRAMHRTGFGLNIVGASATITLLINPLSLFTISFQLSYCAVISILTFGQKIEPYATYWLKHTKTDSKLKRYSKTALKYFIDLIVISIAAQLGTMPLTLYYFNQFSTWFCLTNIFVLPFAQFIAFYSLVFLPFAPAVPQYVYQILCDYIFWIESLPHSTIKIWINLPQMLIIFGIIIAAYRQRWHYVAAALTLILTLTILHTQHINSKRQELIFYADRKADIVQIISGTSQTILTNDTAEAKHITEQINLKYGIKESHLSYIPQAINADEIGKTIFITDSVLVGNTIPHPIECDLLYVGNIGRVGADRLLDMFETKKVLLGGTMKTYKRQQFIKECSNRGIQTHNLITDGAFIINQKYQ